MLPPVDILWNQGSTADWATDFARTRRATLTQCFGYADAMARERSFIPRLGRIMVDGEAVGMVQVLERRGLKFFTARHLHRGPLWFTDKVDDSGFPPEPVVEATMTALRRACPRGLLNHASVLPELPAGEAMLGVMARAGFRRIGPGYKTAWLDLTRSLDALRGAWDAKARKRLRQAEQAGLVIDTDPQAGNLPWLMAKEQGQAKDKGFRPMSGRIAVRLRNALVRDNAPGRESGKDGNGGVLMISALKGGEVAASLLLFVHGRSATTQVSWAGEVGRQTHAQRLLTWKAIEWLKERDITALDLGGINPDHAAGVTEFKLSLGGEVVETVGMYR